MRQQGRLARGAPASCFVLLRPASRSRTLRGAKARGPVSWSGERVLVPTRFLR